MADRDQEPRPWWTHICPEQNWQQVMIWNKRVCSWCGKTQAVSRG